MARPTGSSTCASCRFRRFYGPPIQIFSVPERPETYPGVSAYAEAAAAAHSGLLIFCLCAPYFLLSAGFVPRVIGPEYARSAEALRWLAPLPVLKGLHYFLSDSLTGAGYQGLRTAIQTAVAAFNILINLWIIPAYSWRGAAWSSIASDALLVCGVGAAVLILSRRSRARLSQAPNAVELLTGD